MTNVIISMHGPKVHICMASLLFIPVWEHFSKPFLYIILTFLNYLNLLDKD